MLKEMTMKGKDGSIEAQFKKESLEKQENEVKTCTKSVWKKTRRGSITINMTLTRFLHK